MVGANEDIIILWLTDIHYQSIKTGDVKTVARKKFVKSFLETVSAILNEKKKIDYIILSGDIASSGEPECYEAFWIEILEPLHARIKKVTTLFPKILTIPGNHDLDWSRSPFFQDFLADRKSGQDKNDFLWKNKDKFYELFQSYSNAFSRKPQPPRDEIWRDFFELPLVPLDTGLPDTNAYPERRLYGYFLDKERDILFVMLNTAWYSLGPKFNEIITQYHLHKTDYTVPPVTLAAELLGTKDMVSEYNGQIYGQQMLEETGIHIYLEQNPETLIITCMHHPRNWMAWEEIYNLKSNKLISDIIFRNSDIILSGHEHVPDNVKHEYIGNAIHYKGGMFMDQIKYGYTSQFEHNRFSIFQISNKNQSQAIRERRYLYINDKWTHREEESNTLKRSVQKDNIVIARDELGQLLENFDYEKYMRENDSLVTDVDNIAYSKVGKFKILDIECRYLYLPSTKLGDAIFLCPININARFYETLSESPDKFVAVIKRTIGNPVFPSVCSFLVADGILGPSMYNYDGTNADAVFPFITKYADILFDNFRVSFFEKMSKPNGLGGLDKIRFINHILPYWTVKKYS